MTLLGPALEKRWVVMGSKHNQHLGTALSKTQLLFNESIPISAGNRATHVCSPAPIVIEKLMPRIEQQENMGSSTRSSISFSALSEERLLAAVRLAKRDLRRRRQQPITSSPIKAQQGQEYLTQNTSNGDLHEQNVASTKATSKASSSKEKFDRSVAKVLVYTPQKLSVPHRIEDGRSPPTRDSGPRQTTRGQDALLSQEIQKLQTELCIYIQKIEQQVNKGRMLEEPLEPDEQRRLQIRRQEQAVRSARIIYVLQQQVKLIQEYIEKLQSQNVPHIKKSRAIDKLAAIHRGAIRAIQVFTNQLSEPSEGRMPSHYRELGHLIRQLSLCSAKMEMEQGSAVPQTALDILQKLETLDSVLNKQKENTLKGHASARSSSPAHRSSPHRSASPPWAHKGPTTRGLRGPSKKAAGPKKAISGQRRIPLHPRVSQPPLVERRNVLHAGLENLIQQRGQREERHAADRPHTPNSKSRALHFEKDKCAHMRDARFQKPTVASRLRVNQLPQKDISVPWIPTSPHSPSARFPQRKRPEPRCLFSSVKPSLGPSQQQEPLETETHQGLNSDKRKQAHDEALRQAWLDKVTMQRLRDLNQLSKEETERIQRLRSEVGSPTQWAERAEHEARQRLQPLLDQAKIGMSRNKNESLPIHRLSDQAAAGVMESADQLSNAFLEELLNDATRTAWAAETDEGLEDLSQRRLQAPTLESMLLRMEEMERDQEEVRRRFATISYSDPHYWDRGEDGAQRPAPGSRPVSPQPIRITRPVQRHTSTADIVLKKPVETGPSDLSESSLTEESIPGDQQQPSSSIFPGLVERAGGKRVSVPASALRSIRQYRDEHDAYLRLVAHEAVGSFNPWTIADSLAEELMSEALVDVAAEFQDVCEEYAEAVFTSEFLKPIRSPPSSVPLLGSQ